MARREAQYPGQVFDGISTGNLDRFDRNNNVDPKYHDFDQLAAEIMATQKHLDEGGGQSEVVTKTFWVDSNRTDTYIENGGITKPFKTVQAAIAVASGNCIINVAPGTYAGDIDLGLHVTTLRGSGLNATIFTGNIVAGDRAHTLEEFRIQSTGSLTITDNVTAYNLHLQCALIISGSGSFDGRNVIVVPPSGTVPITMSSIGQCILTPGYISATGDVHAVDQSAGIVVLFHSYVTNNSFTTLTINSTGGVCSVIDTSVGNAGAGPAMNLDNDGSVISANTLNGVVCTGNIDCGIAHTYVEGLNFVVLGALSGSNLIYRPASHLDNDSSAPGATVKAALDGLDARITALGG